MSARLLLTALMLSAPPVLAADWVYPLEGEFSDHWETGEEGRWTLVDGVLAQTEDPESKTWKNYDRYAWFTTFEAADFEAEFEWKCGKNNNSGFYYRTSWEPGQDPAKHEVQIYDSYGETHGDMKQAERAKKKGKDYTPTGKLDNHDAGGLIPGPGPKVNACNPPGEWNTFRITCIDNKLTVELNGVVVNKADLTQKPYTKAVAPDTVGVFAFQDHGYAVAIRNMKIRSLD
ncbi:MAG: DUF1080 domain-containing protein [Planctomycetota bacterium]